MPLAKQLQRFVRPIEIELHVRQALQGVGDCVSVLGRPEDLERLRQVPRRLLVLTLLGA